MTRKLSMTLLAVLITTPAMANMIMLDEGMHDSIISPHDTALISIGSDAQTASIDSLQRQLPAVLREHGDKSTAYAHLMTDLATAYLEQEQYQRAVESIEKAIPILEHQHGLYHEDLIRPYELLGMAELKRERYQESFRAMTRAQHITHRIDGMMTMRQTPYMFYKALSLWNEDEIWKSARVQEANYRIHHHNFGLTDARSIQSARQYGSLLTMIGYFKPALSMYRRHLLAIESEQGPDHPSMVPLLKGQAMTFLYKGYDGGRSISSLKRIIEIQDKHPDSFSHAERYESLMDLAGLYMRWRSERRAVIHYRRAWEFADPEQRRQLSGQLTVVGGPFRYIPEQESIDPGKATYFDLRLDIKADGRARYIKMVDTNATVDQAYSVKSLFRSVRFQPWMVDGVPTDRERQVYRFVIDFTDRTQHELIDPFMSQGATLSANPP